MTLDEAREAIGRTAVYKRPHCAPQFDGEPRTIVRERTHACARCGALCADKQRHYRWHQAVDTGATTLLSIDSAPRSSGAGRPNPKDQR